jgi:hypothetical protein
MRLLIGRGNTTGCEVLVLTMLLLPLCRHMRMYK